MKFYLAGGNRLSESMKSSRFSAGLNNEILATYGIHNHGRTCSTRPCLEFFVGFFPPFLVCNSMWGSSWIRKISNCLMVSDHNTNLKGLLLNLENLAVAKWLHICMSGASCGKTEALVFTLLQLDMVLFLVLQNLLNFKYHSLPPTPLSLGTKKKLTSEYLLISKKMVTHKCDCKWSHESRYDVLGSHVQTAYKKKN